MTFTDLMSNVINVLQNSPYITLSETAPLDWDSFAEEHSAYFFHCSLWGEVIQEGFRSEILYGTLRENGKIVLGMMGIVLDAKFFRMFYSGFPYGGFVGACPLVPELLGSFESALRRKRIHQIRITHTARYGCALGKGYRSHEPGHQHVVELKGHTASSLWEGYRSNIRRDVRRALRSGIRIRPVASEKEVDLYHELYLGTMKRNQAAVFYPKRMYSAIYRRLVPRGDAVMLFAEREGTVIAGIILIQSKDTMHLLGSVSSTEFLSFCPNELLMHHALELTIERGLDYFDFMMSSGDDHRLMKFKSKWGAQSLPFHIFEKNLTWLAPRLWDCAWTLAHSRLGRQWLRWFQSRK